MTMDFDDPNIDAKKLRDQIYHDQAIAGNILRIVNTAFYRGSEEIVSLQQAISRRFAKEMKKLFKLSLVTAIYSSEIARLVRHNVESAFLAGLLHNIGSPILINMINDLAEKDRTLSDLINKESLEETLFHCATETSMKCIQEWNLPPNIELVAKFYKNPSAAPTNSTELSIISFASLLARLILREPDITESFIRNSSLLGDLCLYPDSLDKLLAKKDKVLEVAGCLS